MRYANVIGILLVTIFMWGCRKDAIPDEPSILFIKQSQTMVADSGKGEETLIFYFNFVDGDADVGPIETFPPDPNAEPQQNIVFIDSRDTNKLLRFDFPPIPQSVITNDGVKGTFDVFMDPRLIIADTSALVLTDTVTYEVYVTDKAGHVSNRVKTEPIIITK